MSAYLKHLVRTGVLGTFLYAAGMGSYALLIMAFYGTVLEQANAFDELLKSYPEGLLKAFGMADGLRFSRLSDYLSAEVYSFAWLVVALALALVGGSAAIAQETESGTLGSWLGAGLTRSRYLAARWLSFAIQLAVFVAGTDLGIVAGAMLQNLAVPWSSLLAVSVQGSIFVAVVYALACACSSLFSDRGTAARLAVGLVFLSYAQSIVGSLWEEGAWLARSNVFYLFEPLPLLRTGDLDAPRALAGVALAVALLAFSWWRMVRRDFALG